MAIVSLPMYGVSHQQVEPFWQALRDKLRQLGMAEVPQTLSWPQDLPQHWQRPDLLLSQTCGYPLVTVLPQVQLVGTYHYRVEGCSGANYSSWLVVREDESAERLEDFRDRVVAYNSRDSQSGYNSLRALIAPLAREGRFFRQAIASGSHYQSLEMILEGQADIAAIDCISFALLKRARPQAVAGLKIIGRTAAVPGLPLITAAGTPDSQLAILRTAASAMVNHTASESLLIGDFSLVPRAAYQRVAELERLAANAGVTAL
ncbi:MULTISPECIES: phosphate/phosphite/phosphonate ABC transporter substrate-binding protein [Serratia]|uniref:PhnD/SsuA/transferrin family substrate-binding protein n=1 Tax=Serratia fonticola TaxID=47917 RepID=A0AAJ2DA31_SERFO|nr:MULTISPECIES: PhnD/SsuA/transferrin family substrate-binding protein [Serratia]MDQ7209564.1 PhnD/SsuA/transferrin family substrate-binding protein [Serratia fonticola]MDQ9129907.1 PhnD/SsuA/transferrin family substrate-binding protein [Serratia fonticola]OKP31678.1 phosphate ABC transporter substrate-binding protein [Serratia fonticola]CAI2058474.1 phosphate/phosphite/phosphonate ABC transporters, periplasmic binding protein [Serratia fonticola]